VREIADATLQEIQKVDAEAAAFLSTAVQSEGKEKETVSFEDTTVSRGRRYYVPSHATRSEVTASVVRFSLRAFAETLCATRRFSRGGFRQVELDVAFLTPKLVAFGGSVSGKDAECVDDLLKQCVAARRLNTKKKARRRRAHLRSPVRADVRFFRGVRAGRGRRPRRRAARPVLPAAARLQKRKSRDGGESRVFVFVCF
jgi:hypothetical protein